MPVVAQPASPEAKHKSYAAFDDLAAVLTTGAGTVGVPEASTLMVAVTAVGAVQA